MSQNAKREGPSKINMLFPVALVLSGFFYLFQMPQQKQLKKIESEFQPLVEAQEKTEQELKVTADSMSKVKKQIRIVDKQSATIQRNRDELDRQRESMQEVLAQTSLPAETMRRVTSLLESHRLQVLESSPEADSSDQAEKVLRPINDLLTDKSTNKTSNPSRKSITDGRVVYEVKLLGRFQDLQDALESLSIRHEQVLPLSVQMEPTEAKSDKAKVKYRVWKLIMLV